MALHEAFQRALRAFNEGKLSEAEKLCHTILAAKGDYFDALHLLAAVQSKLGRTDAALTSYDRALAVRPDYAEALNNRGSTLKELRRLDEALASYDRALAVRPDYAEALYNRGNTLHELRRLDEALASYDRALAVRPDYAEALNNRGNTLHELKRLDEALASYDRALAVRPDFAEALNNRGTVLRDLVERELEQGISRLQEHSLNHAEADLRHVLSGNADHPAALHFLGVTACKLGRADEGIAMIRQAVAVEPGRVLGWLDLAVALRDAGRAADALSAYRQAMDLVSGPAETQAITRLDELIFGGPSAYSHIIQMLPVPSRAETIPPLDDLTFSIERAEYAFKFFEYRYRAKVRYGGGRPPHARLFDLIDSERARYADFLSEMAKFKTDFAKISLQGAHSDSVPFWLNTWFPPLDAMTLYTILCRFRPRLFVEVGSGMSTKFARQAIGSHSLGTRMISIDPEPRNEIDPLVDETVRSSLEDIDLQIFDQLEADDLLFFDSSHRSFQNSDVTVFFLEILPSLKPGVVVHLHDIYLPYDYPAGHMRRLWNEQYLLATALLYGGTALELLFPAWFVARDAELSTRANRLLRKGPLAGLSMHGASFWLRIAGSPAGTSAVELSRRGSGAASKRHKAKQQKD